MKTLRLLTISAMALMMLAACQKEAPESPASGSGNKQKLTFTARGEDTRTALSSDNHILWNMTDNITVFSAGTGSTYTVESLSEDALSVTFSGISTLSDTYYALYPASNTASISGDVITATLSGTQVATAGSFADKTNLSVAKSSDSKLFFKNVGALLAITVRNSGLTGITVEAIGGEALAGTAQIAYNDGEPSVTVTSALTQVTLSGSFEAGQTYYCTVFPGNFASGFRITYQKEGYKAVYADSKAVEVTRNSNYLLADITVPDSDWRADAAFAVGDAVCIRNSAEDGQALAYIPADYWNTTTDHYLNDGTYNYEIFTRLAEGEKFYFQSEGNYLFALNAEGTQVAGIKKASQAAYAAPADGIYRIRMVLPSGTAAIQQISRFAYSQYSVLGANLNYVGNGVWEYKNLSMRRNSQSWNNRYKFALHFTDESTVYYGRWSTDKSNPTYGTTSADYFYLQPCDNNDNWEPCFKFPSACEIDEDRFYGDLIVTMNNINSHYTHSIINVRDSQNLPDITPGENILIGGTTEAGQKMVYVGGSDYYNTAMNNFGDAANLDTDAIGDYDYEIYTRLTAGEKVYFSTADGSKYFAPVSDGNAMAKIVAPEKASYTAKSNGVWRIRANFATGKCCIRRIDQVRVELQYHNSIYYTLDYIGNGVWRKEDQVIEWGVESWDAHLSRYVMKMWYNKDHNGDSIDIWQVLGATTNKGNARPAQDDDGSYWNLQPYTGQNWDQIFVYGSWMTDNDHNGRYTATVSAYMNDTYGHYTHRFTNIIDTSESLPSFSAGEKVTIEGDGAAEAGQELSYVATDGYWTTVKSGDNVVSGDADAFSGQTYNYEIFTQLTAGKKIYFKAENGALFALSDGNTVGQVRSEVDGAWTAASGGIYRIRLNLPSSTAYIVKVNSVSLFYCNDQSSTEMTYFARGVWKLKDHILAWQPASYNVTRTETRYHFRFDLGGTNQDYGRHQASYSIPSTARDGDPFNVQPTKVLQWDPSFNYPSTLADASFRDGYKVDINLYMNNNNSNGHYSHEFYNEVDRRPSGSVTSYSVSGSGTEIGASSSLTLSDHYMPVGTDAEPVTSRDGDRFEIFRRFYASGDFFLQDNTGAYYIARSNNTLDKSVDAVSVTGIPEDGIYDMDFNSSALTLNMTRIYGAALFWHPYYWSASYREMTYNGSGYWKTDKFQWSTWNGSRNDDRYRFILFTNSDYEDVDHQGTAAGWVWGKVDGQSHYNAYRFPYGGMSNDWTHCWKPLDGSGSESDNVLRDKYVVFWLDLTGNYRHHIDVSDN